MISNRSTSSALPIELPSEEATKPLAMPPAVSASDARSPVPSSLTERLNTISDRMSASSSGGVLLSAICGARAEPVTWMRAVTPVFGNQPLGGDVEVGVDLRQPVELQRAAALDGEAAALELVEAAHGVGGAAERDRPVLAAS